MFKNRFLERAARAVRTGTSALPAKRDTLPVFANLQRLLPIILVIAAALEPNIAQSTVRDYRRAHERQILDEFTRLLAIPNVASDAPNIRRNAQFILEMMQRRGLNPRLLEAKSRE